MTIQTINFENPRLQTRIIYDSDATISYSDDEEDLALINATRAAYARSIPPSAAAVHLNPSLPQSPQKPLSAPSRTYDLPIANEAAAIEMPATKKTKPKIRTKIFPQSAALSELGQLTEERFQRLHKYKSSEVNLAACQEKKKTKTLITQYWQEALSPEHYFRNPGNKLTPVMYLSNEKERLPFLLTFELGKAFQNGVPFNTHHSHASYAQTGKAIFVIRPGTHEIFAASSDVGKVHHSSFLAGGDVLAAGDLSTDANGNVVEISNLSGHYLPGQEQLLNAIEILAANGVELENVKVLEMDPTGKVHNHPCAKTYYQQHRRD